MAEPYRKKGSKYWWISPVINGVQQPQSTGETDFEVARKKLRIIEGQHAEGIYVDVGRAPTMTLLLDSVRRDYVIKGRGSLKDLKRRIDKHIAPKIGHILAPHVTEDVLAQFIEKRLEEEATPAGINRELAIIKRAFNLNRRTVANPPKFEMLPEDNIREGYFTPEQFQSVLNHIHDLAAEILTVAYVTGWRIKSIIRLEWRQVDLKGGFVWQTERKNAKPVRWPLRLGLRELFENRRQITDEVEREKKRIIPYVFHRNGLRVRSIRKAWEKARIAAGVPGRVIHDFRGTATVNLLEAGVDMPRVMDMVGFKTIQMVARYAKLRGSREDSLIDAAERLEKRLGITVGKKVPKIASEE